MTVSVNAATEHVRTGTTSPQTFSHAGAASGVKGVVLALVHGTSSTDHVTAASYGGVAMTRIQRNVDTATEPGAAELWFLGAGVPQGTQTVSYTPGGTTDDFHAVAITLLGAADTEVVAQGGIDNNVADPSVTLAYGGRTCMAFAALYGGGAAPTSFTPNANCTTVHDHDLGAFYSEIIRQTTADSANFAIGGTAATDDVAFAAIAVSEVQAIESGAGSSAGAASADADGVAVKPAAGSTAAAATAAAVAQAFALTAGAAAGQGAALAVGANASPFQTGAGSSQGAATAAGAGAAITLAAGSAAGVGTSQGDAQAVAQAVGAAAGEATAAAVAQAFALVAGASAGIAVVAGEGANAAGGGIQAGAGSAAGMNSAQAVGEERVRVFFGGVVAGPWWPKKKRKKKGERAEPVIVSAIALSNAGAIVVGDGLAVHVMAGVIARHRTDCAIHFRGVTLACAAGKTRSSRLRAIEDAALMLW